MPRAPKSRFKSAAGKKIEKEVRKSVAMFFPNANIRRGDGVARKGNQQGKPIMVRNIGQARDISMNEKLTSSTKNASKRNVRVSDMAGETNQSGNLASRPINQDPTKQPEIIMTDGNSTSLKERRQHMTSIVKKCLPSSKSIARDDTIEVLSCLEDFDPLKAKATIIRSNNIDNSQPPQFKAMEGLVYNTKDSNGLDQYNDALPSSRLKRRLNLDNGGYTAVGQHSDKKLMNEGLKESSPKRMKELRNIEGKVDNSSDRNLVGVGINEDSYPSKVKDYSGRSLSYGPLKQQRGNEKTIEDGDIHNGDMKFIEVKDDEGTQPEQCIESNDNEVGDGGTNDRFAKGKLESLTKEGYVSLHCRDKAIQLENVTCTRVAKWRNEDEELQVDGGDHRPFCFEGDSSRLTSQAPIPLDEALAPFVSERVKKQCNYCSKPINEPIWRGLFNIDGKEYKCLAGHLSTKSCDKVWKLSRSLMLTPAVEVTKLPRSEAWPETWETSKPSCDSIGLYFFPAKLRHDEDLNKLVNEVVEDDLVLQTVIGEAQMLIFPSTLLPERYKTFRGKHYLWGVFKPRQDKHTTIEEPVHDTACHGQEKENGEKHASNQQDVQQVLFKSPSKSMQQAAATRGVSGSPGMGFQPEAPEGRQQGVASHDTLHSAEAPNNREVHSAIDPAPVTTEAAALATNAATMPAEATENDTNAATTPGHHGQRDPTVGVPLGRVFYFVAGQTPKLEQLIQEMQREGSLVVAIRGRPSVLVLGQATPPPLSRVVGAVHELHALPETADQTGFLHFLVSLSRGLPSFLLTR